MSAFSSFLHELGSISIFTARVFKTFLHTRGNAARIRAQIAEVTWRSLPTVAFSGVFVGAILVLQFSSILARYDALSFLGGLNTSAVVREVGPLLISFLLAGKIGAYTAAELGTMRVTEQIDAVECLGTDPLQYLVVPRFMGIIASSILLLFFGLLVSVGGSIAVASLFSGINPLQFLHSVPRFVGGWTFFGGFLKSAVFGVIVASVSCYRGFTASGGARGVGRAVTLAAVYTNFYIVLADTVTSSVLEWIQAAFELLFHGGAS